MYRNLEVSILTTYRCNARCQMCHIWKYPSQVDKEITPGDIDKLPRGLRRINFSGGEPMLRRDIEEIVRIVSKKTNHLEISTNGYFTDRLVSIAKKHPDIRIRISLEGLPSKNDGIRGIRDGFDHAIRTIVKLKDLGIKDIGFAVTISHRNVDELVDLYHLAAYMGVEFSQCVVHNAWQFRIPNNIIEDRDRVIGEIKKFIRELLCSKRKSYFLKIKDWYRAYVNRGFINFVRGDKRLLPCGAGTDIFFLDPYGEIYPCNALQESMGNIKEKSFEEIWNSLRANQVREMVSKCSKNCWMTGTSRPAIRKKVWVPTRWILRNKIRLALGKNIIWD